MCLLTFRAPISKQQQNKEASSRTTNTPPQLYDLLIDVRGIPASVAPTRQERKTKSSIMYIMDQWNCKLGSIHETALGPYSKILVYLSSL